MPFSYGKFLAKFSSARSLARGAIRGAPANAGGDSADLVHSATGTETTAADSLQAEAVLLPDIDGPSSALQAGLDSAERVEKLLTSLWRMTDDLARIRAEFDHRPGAHRPGPPVEAVPEGGYAIDERAGVIAQVEVIERTICRIVAVLAGPDTDGDGDGGSNADMFVRRVDGQRREMLTKAGEALRQLRLQAIQLAAAVHAYRASLTLARRAIEQARR